MTGGFGSYSHLNALGFHQAQGLGGSQAQNAQSIQANLQQFQNALLAPLGNRAAPPPKWLRPDPRHPDTLGWREWIWDVTTETLRSPSQGTPWPTAEHTAHHWDEQDVIRGVAGIHALLVPRHWKILHEVHGSPIGYGGNVSGIVERFGRYVMGTEGWRSEQVLIRELMAPSTEIGLKLEQQFPNVIVHYSDQIEEGEAPCKSEKSSALEKGSRSPLPSSSPPSSPNPTPSPAPLPLSANARKSLLDWLMGKGSDFDPLENPSK